MLVKYYNLLLTKFKLLIKSAMTFDVSGTCNYDLSVNVVLGFT